MLIRWFVKVGAKQFSEKSLRFKREFKQFDFFHRPASFYSNATLGLQYILMLRVQQQQRPRGLLAPLSRLSLQKPAGKNLST